MPALSKPQDQIPPKVTKQIAKAFQSLNFEKWASFREFMNLDQQRKFLKNYTIGLLVQQDAAKMKEDISKFLPDQIYISFVGSTQNGKSSEINSLVVAYEDSYSYRMKTDVGDGKSATTFAATLIPLNNKIVFVDTQGYSSSLPALEMTLAVARGEKFYIDASKMVHGTPSSMNIDAIEQKSYISHVMVLVIGRDADSMEIENMKNTIKVLKREKLPFAIHMTKYDLNVNPKTAQELPDIQQMAAKLDVSSFYIQPVSNYSSSSFKKSDVLEHQLLNALTFALLQAEEGLKYRRALFKDKVSAVFANIREVVYKTAGKHTLEISLTASLIVIFVMVYCFVAARIK